MYAIFSAPYNRTLRVEMRNRDLRRSWREDGGIGKGEGRERRGNQMEGREGCGGETLSNRERRIGMG